MVLQPKRIAQACLARYNTIDPNPKRTRIPFHWRLQPVIHVSRDGRSTSFRSHNIQLGTANALGDSFNGVKGGGMYHDQFVLEDFGNGTTRRKLWSLTIDEFYWQAATWSGGWAGTSARSGTRRSAVDRDKAVGAAAAAAVSDYPPDVSLKDPEMGERGLASQAGQARRCRGQRYSVCGSLIATLSLAVCRSHIGPLQLGALQGVEA